MTFAIEAALDKIADELVDALVCVTVEETRIANARLADAAEAIIQLQGIIGDDQ